MGKIPQTLKEIELKAIINYLLYKKNVSSFNRFRNATMVYFQYILGLRPKECYNVLIENLDLVNNRLFIPAMDNKERQADYIYLPDLLIPKLEIYLKIRNNKYPDSPYLFTTKIKGKYYGLSRSRYAQIFKDAVKSLGLYKISKTRTIKGKIHRVGNFTPYSLRHSFGTEVFSRTKDIKRTAIMLRHKDNNFRSTMIYVHACEDKLREELTKEIYESFDRPKILKPHKELLTHYFRSNSFEKRSFS